MPELHVPAVDFSSMGEQRLNVLANSFNSEEIAHYFEQRGELSKPWNLQILRLQKLKEMRQDLSTMSTWSGFVTRTAISCVLVAFGRAVKPRSLEGTISPLR